MRFLLPPSPSATIARRFAPQLATALGQTVPGLVVEVAASYSELGDEVASGRCAAAWVPPIVGARVEMAGGRVVLRAVRHGQTRYRAGLVCRRGEAFDPKKASTLTAAWVDEDSAAGYLLARSWLMGQQIDAIAGFRRAFFTHSYVASLQAVADGSADLTSCFCSIDAEGHSTLDEIDERLRERLHVVAWTGDTQTDGVAIGHSVDPASVAPLVTALTALGRSPEGAALLGRVMQCEDLRVAPPMSMTPTSAALTSLLQRSA